MTTSFGTLARISARVAIAALAIAGCDSPPPRKNFDLGPSTTVCFTTNVTGVGSSALRHGREGLTRRAGLVLGWTLERAGVDEPPTMANGRLLFLTDAKACKGPDVIRIRVDTRLAKSSGENTTRVVIRQGSHQNVLSFKTTARELYLSPREAPLLSLDMPKVYSEGLIREAVVKRDLAHAASKAALRLVDGPIQPNLRSGFPTQVSEARRRLATIATDEPPAGWREVQGGGHEANRCKVQDRHGMAWAICFQANGGIQSISVTVFPWGEAGEAEIRRALSELITVAAPGATKAERSRVLTLLDGGGATGECVVDAHFRVQKEPSGRAIYMVAFQGSPPIVMRPGWTPCGKVSPAAPARSPRDP